MSFSEPVQNSWYNCHLDSAIRLTAAHIPAPRFLNGRLRKSCYPGNHGVAQAMCGTSAHRPTREGWAGLARGVFHPRCIPRPGVPPRGPGQGAAPLDPRAAGNVAAQPLGGSSDSSARGMWCPGTVLRAHSSLTQGCTMHSGTMAQGRTGGWHAVAKGVRGQNCSVFVLPKMSSPN
jgi:hypothetical protein